MSEGKVVGPARVILDFVTQAHLIQKGEILITRATDTGTFDHNHTCPDLLFSISERIGLIEKNSGRGEGGN